MIARLKKSLPRLIFILGFAGMLYSQDKQLAFPSAEGGGCYTTGGRGGHVYEVTKTEGGGEGSFSAALGKPGPRTIVFRVSGNIKGDFTIPDNTTIAGQTAPGDGICLHGAVFLGNNVIVRYIRVRGQPSTDAIGGRETKGIMLDHVSASFSTDENVSIYHCENVTIQWCIVSEAMGGSHGFAGIWGGNMNSHHHNLLAHNTGRNPRFCGGARNNDYRNNVVYNWAKHSTKGGEDAQGGDTKGIWIFSAINFVANYYKPGPATPGGSVRFITPGGGSWYVKDNYMVGKPEMTADNWKGVSGGKKREEPAPHIPIKQQTAEEAYESVLKYAGCNFPKRDAIDERIVKDVAEGSFTHGNKGFVTALSQVGGLPELKSTTPPPDGDHDGMPDEWEKAKGLNPADPEDRNGKGEGGYTNLENYLNGLVASHTGVAIEPAKKVENKKRGIELSQTNYFNSSSTIKFVLPKTSSIKLEVLDNSGRRVAALADGIKEAGTHSVIYNGANQNAGVYVLKLTTGNESIARKFFLMK